MTSRLVLLFHDGDSSAEDLRFMAAVRAWRRESGVGAAATALVGFSQGAIMALASTQQDEPPAARVIALA